MTDKPQGREQRAERRRLERERREQRTRESIEERFQLGIKLGWPKGLADEVYFKLTDVLYGDGDLRTAGLEGPLGKLINLLYDRAEDPAIPAPIRDHDLQTADVLDDMLSQLLDYADRVKGGVP
jgi:hypothetical protein